MSNKTSDENVENIEVTNNKNKYIYIKEVAERIVNEYREKYKGEKFCPEPSEQTCMAYEILHLLAELEQKDKRIKELEELVAKLKTIDYMFRIDSYSNRYDMRRIYFEWLENKNKIDKIIRYCEKFKNETEIIQDEDYLTEKALTCMEVLELLEGDESDGT